MPADLPAEIAALTADIRLMRKDTILDMAETVFQWDVNSGEWARRAEVENRHKGPWVEERKG